RAAITMPPRATSTRASAPSPTCSLPGPWALARSLITKIRTAASSPRRRSISSRRPDAMFNRLAPLLLLVAALLLPSAAVAEERILDFRSDVQVQRDGSLVVEETIVVFA